jgi:hypothetical protein
MKLAALASCLLLSASTIFAQGASGTITGTVTDPSGAVVANADVTAKNGATGQIYRAVSTETGNYTVSQLPVGTYSLMITVKGFKTYNREGLDLAATQIMRIDIPLQVGSQTEAVTVTAEASLLKTESGDLTHNVTIAELSELPILATGGAFAANTSGWRDPLALAKLVPGIQYSVDGNMIINGNPSLSIQIRVEGQVAVDTGFLRGFNTIGQASVDSIQEVAVQTSNFAAEYGAVGGGIFNMTMRSGTNQLHGSIYDYAANDILNAAQPYTGLKSATRRHDYGFTVGGPVILPKIYNGTNKSFFQMGFEEFHEDVTLLLGSNAPTVPIDAYRTGNFAQVLAGNNGNPFNVTAACKPGDPLPPCSTGAKTFTQAYIDPLGNTGFPSGTIFDPLNSQQVTCTSNGFVGQPNCNSGTSYTVRLPYSANGGTNNVIPPQFFDPVSLRILNLVPHPVGPNFASGQTGVNYQNPFVGSGRNKIPTVKGDQSFGSKTHVSFYGSGTLMDYPITAINGNAEGFPSPITGARGSFIYTKTYRLNYDYAATPTMLLHLGVGHFQEEFNDDSPGTTTYVASAPQSCTNTPTFGGLLDKTCTGGLGLTGARINRQFPHFIVGNGTPSNGTGGMSSLGPFTQGPSKERRPSAVANVTWIKGNHSYKVGGEWRQERYPSGNFSNATGQYTFGSNSTTQSALDGISGTTTGTYGFPFASFLRGDVTNFLIAQPGSITAAKKQMALFVQDTWKVTRKFTLDYGLRWDYATYGREENGLAPNFGPTTPNPSASNHPGAQIFEKTCGCQFATNYPYAIGPRIGLAYQLNSKTVLRGGVGVVYGATAPPVIFCCGPNTDTTGNVTFWQYVGQLKGGIPSTLNPIFPNLAPNAGQGIGTVGFAPSFLDPNSTKPARQYQWSFSLQREIQRDLVIEASYVGNRGVWWPTGFGGLSAFNAMSNSLLTQDGFSLNTPSDGQLLNSTLAFINPATLSTLALRGITVPYSNFPTTAQTLRQSLLPFPQYSGSISPGSAPMGKTWYDGFQVVLTKRYSHGLTLNANYTFSKNLDLMSSPDVLNPALGKNISSNDLPHQFRLSAEYRTPRLKGGNAFLSNKVVSQILSDWAVGSYLQYQSAQILSRPSSTSGNPISNYLGRGPGPAQLVTDPATGQPMSPWAVNWTDYNGVVHPEPLDINCKCFDPTNMLVKQSDGTFKTGGVLNPNAWANVPDAQWANDFTNLRYYRGFRYPTENLNFGRTFRIKERVQLNVRVEFSNAFNRLQLPQPSASGLFSQAITRQVGGVYNNAPTSGFGAVNPISGTSGMRNGLLVGRLTF